MTDVAMIMATSLAMTLILFTAVIIVKLLNGDVITEGMLSTYASQSVDPERVLVLMATVMGGFFYFSYGLKYGLEHGRLPNIPEELISAMGGGNLLYLSGKILRTGGAGGQKT